MLILFFFFLARNCFILTLHSAGVNNYTLGVAGGSGFFTDGQLLFPFFCCALFLIQIEEIKLEQSRRHKIIMK